MTYIRRTNRGIQSQDEFPQVELEQTALCLDFVSIGCGYIHSAWIGATVYFLVSKVKSCQQLSKKHKPQTKKNQDYPGFFKEEFTLHQLPQLAGQPIQ